MTAPPPGDTAPAAEARRALRLAHVTDPHLSSLDATSFWSVKGKRRLGYLSWQRRRRFIHLREVLARLTAAVRADRPDQVLVTGDLTQLGLPFELEAAHEWLTTLGPPEMVTVVPGNHDVYRGDSIPELDERWHDYLHLGGARFPSVQTFGAALVVGVTSAFPAPWHQATGRVGRGQLERMDAALAAHADRIAFVMIHHPPSRLVVKPRKALEDDTAFCAVLARRPPVIVLSGHIHRNTVVDEIAGVRMFTTASASSAAAEHPASYRLFDVSERADGVEIEMTLKTDDGETFRAGAPEVFSAASLSLSDRAQSARPRR